jgi:hypothetical protein
VTHRDASLEHPPIKRRESRLLDAHVARGATEVSVSEEEYAQRVAASLRQGPIARWKRHCVRMFWLVTVATGHAGTPVRFCDHLGSLSCRPPPETRIPPSSAKSKRSAPDPTTSPRKGGARVSG